MAFVFLLLAWAGVAQGSTVCSSGCDHSTIKAAYDDASASGDTIEVTDSRTYTETFNLSKSITIRNTGATRATWKGSTSNNLFKVVSGAVVTVEGFILEPGDHRVIQVEDSSTLTLEDIQVDGIVERGRDGLLAKVKTTSTLNLNNSEIKNLDADEGGAIFSETSSTINITNTTFDGNTADKQGGVIYAEDSTVNITGSTFINSEAEGNGGTIFAQDSTLVIVNSTFGASEVTDAGSDGGHIWSTSTDGTLDSVTITNTDFSNGIAVSDGGAVGSYLANVSITGGTFNNNQCGRDGGAVHAEWAALVEITGATFTNNTASDDGGGVNISITATAVIDSSTFISNDAGDDGGGLRCRNTTSCTITDNEFSLNSSTSEGGGVAVTSANVATITDNDFFTNTSALGGGLRIQDVGDIESRGGHYCANDATSGDGGGVWISGVGTGFVSNEWTNNVFNENTAGTDGGAVYVENNDVSMINNHFLTNDAGTDGGALYLSESDYTFTNNLVAWTAGGNGIHATWASGSSFTMDYNDWFSNTSSNAAGSLSSGSLGANSIFVDPLLEDYTSDGNCTNDELWPSFTSPLIDAGDPTIFDPAPASNRSDIGAFGGPDADAGLFIDGDSDGYTSIYDCDDGDGSINPGATEVCDGANVDENCNGLADDLDATVDVSTQADWYIDGDLDSYGDLGATAVQACDDPSTATDTYVSDNTDCDDSDDGINPGATEVCDAADVDEDCDGLSDDDDGSVAIATQTGWYPDADNDTYGDDSTVAMLACDDPSTMTTTYVTNNGDCDDSTGTISPAAAEVTGDEIDQDCDGGEVCNVNSDGDGYRADTGTIDSTDTDCTDAGEARATDPGGDCDDGDGSIYPGADEYCDGKDNDCDSVTDESDAVDATTWYDDDDTDGYGDDGVSATACTAPTGYIATGGDCDDADSAINPGADEYCDTVDNNCDGVIDEDTAVDASTWYADTDSDGFGDPDSTTKACNNAIGWVSDDTDCDDSDGAVYPGAMEMCDSVDNDCDTVIDEDDAIDAKTWYLDDDDDGYGDKSSSTKACEEPTGYTNDDQDCDDADPDINPGADEYCDSVDNNCDGVIDEDTAVDASTWYLDDDGDGYGLTTESTKACIAPTGYVSADEDCDDADPAVYPGADEYCDSVDTDCDGVLDEDDAIGAPTWYGDEDADGFGLTDDTLVACDQPDSYAEKDGDCDDLDALTYPGASELCDGVDNDCDDIIDEDIEIVPWYPDTDKDGFGNPDTFIEDCKRTDGYVLDNTDCDDTDGNINPGEEETWYDGTDQDCDGWSDYDQDRDGFDFVDYGGEDCVDDDAEIHPDADEIWYDGTDQDCDGWSDYDQDRDGFDSDAHGGEDCEDENGEINPGVEEIADNDVDEDCDGRVKWSATDDREWSPELEAPGTGCDCSVTGATPAPHLIWLFLTGVAGLRLRRRP